jgi:hypothetical protein
MEGSWRNCLAPESGPGKNCRVSFAVTVIRLLEAGVTICGHPPAGT